MYLSLYLNSSILIKYYEIFIKKYNKQLIKKAIAILKKNS